MPAAPADALDDGVVRVGAVDDHPVVLAGLARLLEGTDPPVELVATASTVEALLARGRPCDVVLLDIRLGDGSTPATNTVRLVRSGARVVVYTDGVRPSQVYAAVSRGALGVVLKDDPREVLVQAVLAAHRGEALVSSRMARALEAAPDLQDLLTPQELQVLRLYAGDLPAKSVARRMSVTEATVKEYLKRIRAKLASAEVGGGGTKLGLRDVAETMGLLDEERPPALRPRNDDRDAASPDGGPDDPPHGPGHRPG